MTNKQTIDGVPLMPCPFCGGKADTKCTGGDYPNWHAECLECSASADIEGPYSFYQWNRRAAQPQGEVERLREEAHQDGILRVHYGKQIDTLRAQLAERDALLREAWDVPAVHEHMPKAWHDRMIALSTSAEPTKQEAWALQVEKDLGIERLPAEPKPRGEAAAYALAEKVREALDRKACPNAWMVVAYEAVVSNFRTEQPAPLAQSTSSDQYKAEQYDEVWQKARDMGFENVTDALAKLEAPVAADNSALLGLLTSEISMDDKGFYHLSGINPGNFNRAIEASGATLSENIPDHKSPVAKVVLPERMYSDSLPSWAEEQKLVRGWNACLDEVAKLNGINP